MNASQSRRVPRDQIESVVKALYAAADRLDWEHLPPSARTNQYDEWVTDTEIGGVLTKYMSVENARSWIKDGPMKEYGRARLGAGRYARFGSSTGPTPRQLVAHALGNDAVTVDGSVGIKPFHCLATIDGATTYLAWDSAKNLRHLIWASIDYLADHPSNAACVIVLESMERPTTQAERRRHARIAERCSIPIKYYRAAQRPSGSGEKS
ncbi:hypothetical protein ACFUC1_02795 [Pedococcus sp. NPDC057267]|uniref:hypothetical protein n=1 Tax=Pedococcus sp. NPDC057267 TaxID=3346077 RepID=UPI003634046E